MDRSKVAIVIPAWNEEATIGKVVRFCKDYGLPLVIDDGSFDHTGEISRYEGAEVVRHETNRGYDEALNSGFRKAAELGCDFVVTIDADGQHDPELLVKYIGLLDAGMDIVVGSRNRKPRFSEHLFAVVTRALYGISDPLCGLKGYRMSLYGALGYFDSYESIGTELMLFAVRNGFQFAQVPVIVRERSGASRFGRKIDANFKILRAMFFSFPVLGRFRS